MLVILSFLFFQGRAAGRDITLEGFEKWTFRLPMLLERRWDAVVEAKVDAGADFEVTRSLYGHLQVGQKLAFDQCDQIRIMGSTVDYLDRAARKAPVLDVPREKVSSLTLPDDRKLASFAPPHRDARFILVIRGLRGQHWGFLDQTLGDFFLIQEGKVFALGYAYEGQDVPPVWAPIMPTVGAADFEVALQREIAKRRSRDQK